MSVTRRALLSNTARGVGVAFALPLLQACAPAAPTAAPTAGSTGALKLPTYVPFQGPKPDLPGTPQGVADAYFSYPKNLVKTVTTPPGTASSITLFTNPAGGAPPPLEQNPAWQQVNKDLNVNF